MTLAFEHIVNLNPIWGPFIRKHLWRDFQLLEISHTLAMAVLSIWVYHLKILFLGFQINPNFLDIKDSQMGPFDHL